MTNIVNLKQQTVRAEKTDWFEVLPAELATTADRTSSAFQHPDPNIGLALKVVLANEVGVAISLTVNITTKDPAGNTVVWYTSGALINAGTTLILIKPEGGTNSLFTIVPFPLPREFYVLLDYTGTPATDKMDTLVYGAFV